MIASAAYVIVYYIEILCSWFNESIRVLTWLCISTDAPTATLHVRSGCRRSSSAPAADSHATSRSLLPHSVRVRSSNASSLHALCLGYQFVGSYEFLHKYIYRSCCVVVNASFEGTTGSIFLPLHVIITLSLLV